MTLIEFLKRCKKLVDENPDALNMEMFAEHGASGAIDPISTPFVDPISDWDNSEYPVKEMVSSDYPYDSIIRVYIGN